jgi:hypothetical protein
MQIVVQVHSLNLPYFPFFHVSCPFLHSNVYTIMNLFITLLENVNKSRTSANNVSLSDGIHDYQAAPQGHPEAPGLSSTVAKHRR